MNKRARFVFPRKRFRLAALVFAAVVPATSALRSTPAQTRVIITSPTPISLAEYKLELDRVRRSLEQQLAHPPSVSGAENFDAAVPPAWLVDAGGEKFWVSTDKLKFRIQPNPNVKNYRQQRFDEALEQVRLLETAANQYENSPDSASRNNARAELAAILQRREFRQLQEQKSWLAQLWDRFLNWIWRIILRIFGAANNKVVQRTVLYGAIIVAFLLLAGTLVRTMTAAARRENLKLAAAPPAGKTWSQWAREAIAAANTGNFREAVHAAYWAGVYRLAEIGTWQLDRARTPREYLRMLQRAPGRETQPGDTKASASSSVANPLADPAIRARRADALANLTNRLESVWYDNQIATQEDYLNAVRNLETLECRFPSMPQTASS